MHRSPTIRIGCSGWQYRHWKGDFYPGDLRASEWLDYYARHFDTVEVNNSFYRLPDAGVFEKWRAATPPGFLFAVKASRFLTHMKKLKDSREPLERLFSRASELGRKLGPVLYQLPRQMSVNVERLAGFLEHVPPRVKHVIEFRNPDWYDEEIMRLLRRHHVALCLHDMPGSIPPRVFTAGFTYIRLHGGQNAGAYTQRTLNDWAAWIVASRRHAFVYFNNDTGGHAPRDARRLRALLDAGRHVKRGRPRRVRRAGIHVSLALT